MGRAEGATLDVVWKELGWFRKILGHLQVRIHVQFQHASTCILIWVNSMQFGFEIEARVPANPQYSIHEHKASPYLR